MQNPINMMWRKFWTLRLRPDGLSLIQMLQGKKTDLQKSLMHIHALKMFEMYVCFFSYLNLNYCVFCERSEYIIN